MVTTSVREARLNLSKLLKLVEKGHEIVIRNRDRPVAKNSALRGSAAWRIP